MTPDQITRSAILLARRQELQTEQKQCKAQQHPMVQNMKLYSSSSQEWKTSSGVEVSYAGYMSFLDQEISSIEKELAQLGVELV